MGNLSPLTPRGSEISAAGAVEMTILPRAHDLGGFSVRRALPATQRQMVGPFIFFDHLGPAHFSAGTGVDVRPHPHIGLGTVTFLYRGEFQHRDSLGNVQMIYPGELNWMVAGRGVTHSERTSPPTRAAAHDLFGIQTWIALPEAQEDRSPSFEHHGKDSLPRLEAEGVDLRLILGSAYGAKAPATMLSETFYADVRLAPGARLALPKEHEERAAYVVDGSIEVAGESFDPARLLVFRAGDAISVTAGPQGAHLVLLGGAAMSGPRYVWWNFVSSDREKIAYAREQWRRHEWGLGLFDLPPDDRAEFIPLP